MKIAIVHDYLIDYGGAEKVLYELHKLYPKAPIYVSLINKRGMGKFMDLFSGAVIKKSWFGYVPFSSKLISPLRFLMPLIWGSFDFSKYDVVITSASWAVTKGIKKPTRRQDRGPKTVEICYCHTPPRYLYGYDASRIWKDKWYGFLVNMYSTVVSHYMRMYDFRSAQKVDHFIANSKNTGKRIKKFYRRKFEVIYPPVDVSGYFSKSVKLPEEDYYLAGGRLVAAKNFDLIIKACKKARVKLKVYGTGIEKNHLEKLAGNNTELLGRVSSEELIAYYKGAKAFIIAQKDEDFGITPVEAAASGCPVIAYRGGGYLESVVNGKTGVFFDNLTEAEIVKAITSLEKLGGRKTMQKACIAHAKKFSTERFRKEIRDFVNKYA